MSTNSFGKDTNRRDVDIVVFGGGGDLARRKLVPSLYDLYREGSIPSSSRIIGVSRSDISDDGYRDMMASSTREFTPEHEFDSEVWHRFAKQLSHRYLDVEDTAQMRELGQLLRNSDTPRIFYLALPPQLFAPTCKHLGQAGLITPETRVVLEKPIGRNLPGARQINAAFAEHLDEHQVFRIDHYLGKETVQNLMALRFGNSLFEPLWRRGRIEQVQITVAESIGVGDRGGYYDKSGALRDMVQNHLLQLLCMVAMEAPTSLDADAIRDEKLKVLRSLRRIDETNVRKTTVRGQYVAGAIDGEPVPGYTEEEGVHDGSDTETYCALQVDIDNWRWAGVPFYLRTGKRLPDRFSEITLQLRPVPLALFGQKPEDLVPNRLVIRLQPDEGIKLRLMVKGRGRQMKLEPVNLDLNLAHAVRGRPLSAYERLLLEVYRGDPTLFMRRDEVEAAWSWIDPILEGWAAQEMSCKRYVAGTWGPSKAVSLLDRNNHVWAEDAP